MFAVEHEVLVDLVGDRDQVVLDAELCDLLELVGTEDLARGVVRRVEEQQPRAWADRTSEILGIERVVGRPEGHDSPLRTGHRDRSSVRVVVRLEGDDLVAGLAEREQRRRDGLRRARGHQHLGLGVVLEPVPTLLVRGNRVAQLAYPGAGRVLVVAREDRVDRHLLDDVRSVDVGEPLTEVDRAGALGERRHLGEDRGAEPSQPRSKHHLYGRARSTAGYLRSPCGSLACSTARSYGGRCDSQRSPVRSQSVQPFPTRSATMDAFAEHVSRGKVETFEALGIDIVLGRREGAFFWDAFDDRRFFNCHCNGGVFNLGHRNPEILARLHAALADDEIDVGNHHLVSGWKAQLGRRLASTTGDRCSGVVLSPSGSEAVEVAIKTTRVVSGREGIVSVARRVPRSHCAGGDGGGCALPRAFRPRAPGLHQGGVRRPQCDGTRRRRRHRRRRARDRARDARHAAAVGRVPRGRAATVS